MGQHSADAVYLAPEKFHLALAKVNFVGTSSVVLRRASLSSKDRFNEELKNSDDRLFWLLFSLNHGAVFVNKILHSYRILDTGISKRSFLKRGPSKIKALTIAMRETNNKAAKSAIRAQISRDYASMAYAYKLEKNYKSCLKASSLSLKFKLTFWPLKLFCTSIVAMILGIFIKT